MPARDVDRLDPLPDAKILAQDKEYMVQHKLDKLFGDMMTDILRQKPHDPLQFIIDSMTLGPEHATQDNVTGLPLHRQQKLEQVFKIINKDGSGKVSLRMLQKYASQFGGETLTLEDLQGLFQDFKPSTDGLFEVREFLMFFSRVSRTMPNSDFNAMIDEMSR